MVSYAQFEEHFLDGGFNVSPHWDTLGPFFIVTDQVLNLNGASTGGKAAIVTMDTVGASAEWGLYLRMGFQPSDDDRLDVVLVSDEHDIIHEDYQGYFVRIGHNGVDDALDFYRKDGANEILRKRMMIGQFQNGADGNLKVVKNNLGKWWFYWKNSGETSFTLADSTVDRTYNTSDYFGMICTYTAASKDSFWFDDLYSLRGILLPEDETPPTLVSVQLVNSRNVDVLFSENVDVVTAQSLLNYNIPEGGIGHPLVVVVDPSNPALLHLTFGTPFNSKSTYTLSVTGIRDSVGNTMPGSAQQTFVTPYYAKIGDVLFNELMLKPLATGGTLPNQQYIELRNMTSDTILMKNWSLNGKTLTGTPYLMPGNLIILCSNADTNLFIPYGNTNGVINWTALPVEGFISIRSEDNTLIDTLTYNDVFYKDDFKKQGGWSMELNQAAYFSDCPRDIYWSAPNAGQGSPGENNLWFLGSIPMNSIDTLIAKNIIEVRFAHFMQIADIENISNYSMDNGISIASVEALDAYGSKVRVTLSRAMDSDIVYHLTVKQMTGCVNNTHLETVFEYAFTAIPQPGDIIINEVLFQPNAGGSQFVELYNKTNRLFKIKDLKIIQASTVTGADVQVTDLSDTAGYFFPKDYLVFTQNRVAVKSQYPQAVLSKIINVGLPLYDETEDVVVLKNADNTVIDRLQYSANWHFPLLKTRRGVSLEKSSFDLPTQVKRYWHSASEEVTFATPGYLNSENTYELEGDVHIIPEIFSPDGDGVDDIATITYSFDDDGSVVNAYLYTADGRLANHLVKDVSIPKEGYFTWDGTDENGNKKDVGIYFLVFERKTPDGRKLVYKRRCVLAAKLN